MSRGMKAQGHFNHRWPALCVMMLSLMFMFLILW